MTHLEEIEALKKEIDILRDQAQIDRLELDKAYFTNTTLLKRINNLQTLEKEHKKYVGDLLKELDSYKDKLQKLVNDPNSLRKLGVY
jgi:DNA repair ATPase RecN